MPEKSPLTAAKERIHVLEHELRGAREELRDLDKRVDDLIDTKEALEKEIDAFTERLASIRAVARAALEWAREHPRHPFPAPYRGVERVESELLDAVFAFERDGGSVRTLDVA
jgi:phage shock protein A